MSARSKFVATASFVEKRRQLVGFSRERVFSLHTRAAGDGDIASQKCTASLPNDLGRIFTPGREAGEAPAFLPTCYQQ